MPSKRTIKNPTNAQIINGAWKNENPRNLGYDSKTKLYSKFRDPNGIDWLVGPGIKIQGDVKDREYTREELDNMALSYGKKSLESIGKSYNEKYGTKEFPTPWDTVSVGSKLLMQDVRYRTGRLPQSGYPKLYQAVADGNYVKQLQESRTKYTRNGKEYPDNDRVRRSAESFFPGMFNVTYEKDSWNPVTITRKKKQNGGKISLELL